MREFNHFDPIRSLRLNEALLLLPLFDFVTWPVTSLPLPVGAANVQRLNGPEIESWWRRDIPYPSRTAVEPTHAMGTGSFLGAKQAGRDIDHLHLSSAEVKERVELYIYSFPGPSWPVLRQTLPLPSFNFTALTSCNCGRHKRILIGH